VVAVYPDTETKLPGTKLCLYLTTTEEIHKKTSFNISSKISLALLPRRQFQSQAEGHEGHEG
jgi:hypothetical protein